MQTSNNSSFVTERCNNRDVVSRGKTPAHTMARAAALLSQRHTDTDVYSRRDGGRKVSRRFPFRTVTLFAPDDSYLGTRKFMDLLTTQTHTQLYIYSILPLPMVSLSGFAYDENINRKDTRQFSPSSLAFISIAPPPRRYAYSDDLQFIGW